MARSHLTLAALATSAVPGLDVAAAQRFSTGRQGDFDSALLTTRDGRHFLVRVPTSAAAETAQTADLVALQTLSSGVRSRLPFVVSNFVGQTPVKPRTPQERPTRAVVYEFVYGQRVELAGIPAGEPLAVSIAHSIAAIHSLPTSFVLDGGLPQVTAIDSLRSVVTLMDRAAATSLVPAPLLSRWESATDDTSLWQFPPTVVHGSLTADSLLHAGGGTDTDRVVGVLGWSDLRIADPARDLSWALSIRNPGASDGIFAAYAAARQGSADRQIRHRAMLYAELELARWLLYGTDTNNSDIVADAVSMLHNLRDRVTSEVTTPLSQDTGPVLDVEEVERLLDEGPQVTLDQRARSSLSE